MSFSGCEKKNEPVAQEPETIKLASSAALGSYLADAENRTLYYFTKDTEGNSVCTSPACLATWPIFYDAKLKVSAGLQASDFTTITHPSGQPQTAYKGLPLYYYALKDAAGTYTLEAPGQTLGSDFGSVWFVLQPQYTVLLGQKVLLDKSTNATSAKNYLMDIQGRTLYTYAKDSKNPTTQSDNCTGSCAAEWPIFYAENVVLPTSAKIKLSDFGTISRNDGPGGSIRKQTTYKGMPLYYCTGDNNLRGKTNGHNLGQNDELWVVAGF